MADKAKTKPAKPVKPGAKTPTAKKTLGYRGRTKAKEIKEVSIKNPKSILPKTKEVIFILNGLDKEGHQKYKAIPIYKKIPKGWKITEGAMTGIKGYKWIDNKKSLFSKDRKTAFIKDKQ